MADQFEMLAHWQRTAASSGSFAKPKLLVVVDTEEEFDWGQTFSRSAIEVAHMRHQDRGQRLWERYGVRPTYVVDYAIASQEAGFRVLREWFEDGLCALGAHLHPWVNPPFDEEVSAFNSYPGNLPAPLERAKLAQLTETIAVNLGHRPRVYRAGRYGIGPATAATLHDLGYEIDTSVVPFTDFGKDGGPNFWGLSPELFWFGPGHRLLEIPLTVGYCGLLRGRGAAVQPRLMSDVGMRLHLPGAFARLGLFERIRLTPEGVNFDELKRVTDALLASGTRVFVFSYHSPSLVAGNTPYVRNQTELGQFLGRIDAYCQYFFGACGGEASTPQDVRSSLAETAAA
jgi:hypothetical protein